MTILTKNKYKSTGLFISRPVGVVFFVIYIIQAAIIVWLVLAFMKNNKTIMEQKQKIEELEQKVKILDIIEEYQIGFNDNEVGQLTNVIYDESKKFSIDPLLILAVIIAESSFKRHQESSMGAEGLMQVMPSVGKDVAEKWRIEWPQKLDLNNPGLNIKVGTAYLFQMILKFKDIKKALIAYNMGEGVTDEYIQFNAALPLQYYKKVVKIYKTLRSRFETK